MKSGIARSFIFSLFPLLFLPVVTEKQPLTGIHDLVGFDLHIYLHSGSTSEASYAEVSEQVCSVQTKGDLVTPATALTILQAGLCQGDWSSDQCIKEILQFYPRHIIASWGNPSNTDIVV
ncbi:hypothetical protein MCOR25_006144 [Pyricularia grisea]|nr:hypothetical protein MCOR25_006144 [Pyricularia grisea]